MIHLFHNYHILGGFHTLEWRLLPETKVWSYRIKAVPDQWIAISEPLVGSWAFDGDGLCWATLDGCSYRMTPMHKTKEWSKGHYDEYATRNDKRHSLVPSHVPDYGKNNLRTDNRTGYQT